MSTHNVLVEVLGTTAGDAPRETNTDAPAIETENARYQQIGTFRDDEPPPAQAATQMVFQAATGDEDAPIEFIAGRPGKIVGLVAQAVRDDSTATIGTGTVTLKATVGGAAVGDALVLNLANPKRRVDFTTPVSFNSLDELGMSLATSGDMTSVSNFFGYLCVVWSAASAS